MDAPRLAEHPTQDQPTTAASLAAVAGVIAVGLALAVSHLLDGLSDAIPSLVVTVGDVVIDTAPAAVEQWAIATLGTFDKPALILGILVISAAIGAAIGAAAVDRFDVAVAAFVAFAALGAWAAAAAAPTWAALLSATISAAVGLWALRSMLTAARGSASAARPAPHRPGRSDPADNADVSDVGSDVGSVGTASQSGTARRTDAGASRREFLRMAGGLGAATVISAAAGRFLLMRESAFEATAETFTLPAPAIAAPDVDSAVSFDIAGLGPWVTPNEEFYRIDTALRVPRVDVSTSSVAITGMVDQPFELTYEDLLAMPLEEHYITLACVSNEVGGDLVDNARWLGVRLDRLLERAQVQSGADQIVGRSVDGFTAGFPTEVAFDGRDALLAVGMNGEPLPADHGYPARLVVPGLFGYVSATKWLSEIELTTLDGFDGYWIPRGWAKFGPVVTQSQIDVPKPGAMIPAGPTAVAGIAYAPTRGIADVEVQIDDGPWRGAELGTAYNEDTWRQWLYRWDATPGRHRLTVRATDGTGEEQIVEESWVVPDGATGLHSIDVEVS